VKKQDTTKFLLLGLGGFAAYQILKNVGAGNTSSSGTASSGGITGTISQIFTDATDTLATLTGSAQANFVTVMTPIANAVGAQFGIDPLCIMTQAALESGWGLSGLTKKANNLYGYTGDAALNQWLASQNLPANTPMPTILAMDTSAAPFIIMQTHEQGSANGAQYWTRPGDIISQSGTDYEVYRPFRRYDSWQSSVNDWVALMQTSRYASAWGDLQAGDLNAFANDVYAAGYATESDYPTQLVSVSSEIQSVQTA